MNNNQDSIGPVGTTPLCGWEWYYQHRNQYADWVPSVEIIRPGSKFTINVKNPAIMSKIMKEVNK